LKKYNIIYADCPWTYNDKANAGKRGASHKYPTQSEDWLKSLPVKDIAADDCVLFMWVTMPKLPDVFEVIKAWGFEYKTCAFTWVKKNKLKNSYFMGMGNWTRSNPELCLLATKGKPKRLSASVLSIIDSPIQSHSEKPSVTRDKIVELMGDLPRVELFSRHKVEKWDSWGNQVENDLELI